MPWLALRAACKHDDGGAAGGPSPFIVLVDKLQAALLDAKFCQGEVEGTDLSKVTDRAQKRRFSQKTAFLRRYSQLEIQAFRGCRKPQKTADLRRKPKIFIENRRKPQIGVRHLRSVTLSAALFCEKTSDSSFSVQAKLNRQSPRNSEDWGGQGLACRSRSSGSGFREKRHPTTRGQDCFGIVMSFPHFLRSFRIYPPDLPFNTNGV